MPLRPSLVLHLHKHMREPKLRFRMAAGSHILYLAWRCAPLIPALTVSLEGGEQLCLRRPPSTDSGVAYEVIAKEVCRRAQVNPASIKRVVDLGAHVGISVIYWAYRYPEARIDAYEPHPVHLGMLDAHLKLNRTHHALQ